MNGRAWWRVRAAASVIALASCGSGSEMLRDADVGDDARVCTAIGVTCASDRLESCAEVGSEPSVTACPWGCATAGEAIRCAALVPAGGGVEPADIASAGELFPLTIAAYTLIDGSTGRMVGGANRAPGEGVIDGVGFVVRGNVGVFTFGALTLKAPLVLDGTNAIAIISAGPIAINHQIDARGRCKDGLAGPGGFAGGLEGLAAGGGPGGVTGGDGATAEPASGGGGGGHATIGGRGGASGDGAAGGGGVFGDDRITVLVGGAGGGAGTAGTGFARGGGGGGAIQIVSNISIVIEGTINASGCGGEGGGPGTSGGGGGAGGTILLEAPTIQMRGSLAVNGGGGGGGYQGTDGENGDIGRVPAPGGIGGDETLDAAGGAGAAGSAAASDGAPNATRPGGGGGARGRIRFHTRDDAGLDLYELASLSPEFSDPETSCTRGAATTE